MLVHQPLHDALLFTADIHDQDEEGVRQGGALSEDAQYIKMSLKTNSIGVRWEIDPSKRLLTSRPFAVPKEYLHFIWETIDLNKEK